jgi:hypothetical protein
VLPDEKLWTNELQDFVVTSLVVLPEDQQLRQLQDMLREDIHVRQCSRVDKYVAEQATQKREEDEAKKREEENREAEQAVFNLRMERLKEDRLDEQWQREEQQKELGKWQWRERKELAKKADFIHERQQKESEEEKLKAKDWERLVMLGEMRYPNRPDLEAASRRARAWAQEQEAKAEEKMEQNEILWRKKLAEEALKVKEMKRTKVIELLNRQASLEVELENLVYMVRLTEVEKYRRKMEILDELEILELEIKKARDALWVANFSWLYLISLFFLGLFEWHQFLQKVNVERECITRP